MVRDLIARTFVPAKGNALLAGEADCTAHQETFQKLIQAIGEKWMCKIVYQAMGDGRAKSYYVKPLKIFSHKGTVYLHARKASRQALQKSLIVQLQRWL